MDHCRASELEYVLGPRKGSILETKFLLLNVFEIKPFSSLFSNYNSGQRSRHEKTEAPA